MEQGKLMPQDTEAEEYLIGSLLIDSRQIPNTMEVLTADCFYKENTKLIYEAMIELVNSSTGVDIMTISNLLRKKDKIDQVGGAYYILGLSNKVGSTANTLSYAAIIKQKHLLRQLINLGQDIAAKGFKNDCEVNDLIAKAESELTKITSKVILSKYKSSKELYTETLHRNDEILKLQNENKVIGVPTGLKKLDKKTSGWQKGDLVILAARPSMGKTSLALTFASEPAMNYQVPTAFFSLEMTNQQLYARLVSQTTDVELRSIMFDGMAEWQIKQVLSKSDLLCDAPIYFDDQPSMSLFEVQNKARKLKREKGIELLVVDYLQLIKNETRGFNREAEIASISRGLKALAKELDIPVIALAQLSRASEKRGAAARPMLSDLRESGSIEQDADVVIFIHRDEYYGILQTDDGSSTVGVAEIIFGKGRNIGMGETKVGFDGRRTKFYDLETQNYNEPNF